VLIAAAAFFAGVFLGGDDFWAAVVFWGVFATLAKSFLLDD